MGQGKRGQERVRAMSRAASHTDGASLWDFDPFPHLSTTPSQGSRIIKPCVPLRGPTRYRKKVHMLTSDMEKLYPSAKTLVKECVASRVLAKDASLYDFSDGARETAENFMRS